jgi:hypothetical protein
MVIQHAYALTLILSLIKCIHSKSENFWEFLSISHKTIIIFHISIFYGI